MKGPQPRRTSADRLHQLPTHEQAEKAVLAGTGTPLDHFIAHYEVVDDDTIWRHRLKEVIKQAYKLGWDDGEGALATANAQLERERDAMKGERDSILQEAMEETAALKAQRDAATAALAKAEGALRKLIEATESMAWSANSSMADRAIEEAEAALTPAPEAPKDGE